MKRTRKLLAIFLVVCMIASYAPAAFADGEEATALAGDEVVVTITDNGGSVSFTATLDGEQVAGEVLEGAIEQTIADANNGIVGAGVATEEGGTGTPDLEAESIESTVNGDVGSSGAFVQSVTKDNTSAEASLTVNGDISSEHGCGIDVRASSTASDPDVPGPVTAVATVDGDVKDSISDEYANSTGINVIANNYAPSDASIGEAAVNVVVNGENGVSAESVSTSVEHTISSATGVFASAGENSNVVVSVTIGDVKAATTNEDGLGNATGVIANSNGSGYYDNEQEQFVNTSVKGGTVEVTVAGEVSAVGITDAIGVETSASGKAGSATATVGGGVTASATGGDEFGNAFGARANANSDNSQSVLDIGGSVTAVGLSSAFGAQAETQNYMESSAAITVGGNITATVTGQNGGATGAIAGAEGEKASASLEIGGMVTATGVNGASGVLTQANNKESTAASTVGGNVNATATGQNGGATGANASASGEKASAGLNIGGMVTATGVNHANGVQAQANKKESTAVITVGGDVNARIAGQNGGATGANANASGEKASASLEIGGMVTATGVNYANGVQAQAQNKESTASVTVGSDVTATATGADGYGSTIGASANASGEKATALLDIGGQISASGINNVRGVQVLASNNGAAVTTSVKGNVTSNATGEYGYASGVNATAARENTFVVMDIGGDIKAAGTSYTEGILTSVQDKNASSTATVSGAVSATTTGESGSANAVSIYANGDSSAVTMDIGGTVTAAVTSKDGNATGVNASAYGENSSVSLAIGGMVTAAGSDYANGLRATAETTGSAATVTVGGDVTATSSYSSVGLQAAADGNGATTEVTVDGIVKATVTGTDTEESSGYRQPGRDGANGPRATGVLATASGENASITAVVGGVDAAAQEQGVANAVLINAYDKANATVKVGEGGITATGGDSSPLTMNIGAVLGVSDGASASLEVAGDVTAESEGIILNVHDHYMEPEEIKNPGSIDVLVEGTLSGGNNSILVGTAALKDADVTLTIWEATLNDAGNVIGVQDYSQTKENLKKQLDDGVISQEEYDQWIAGIEKQEADIPTIAEELEKNILYIIKVEDNENASLTLAGTTKSHDWDVAKQDETVTLSALVQSGYRLVGVYNGDTLITADADGNYSIVVPKGGGVYYHVQLEKIEPAPSGETYIPVDNKAKEKAEAAKAETDAVKAVEEITAKDQRGEAVVVAVGALNQMTATETMKKDYESLSDSLVNADKALAAGGQTVIPPEIKALARENATLIAGQAFRCVASSYPATVTVKLDNADSFVGMMIFVNGKWIRLDAVINDDGTVTYTLPGPSILSFVYQEG